MGALWRNTECNTMKPQLLVSLYPSGGARCSIAISNSNLSRFRSRFIWNMCEESEWRLHVPRYQHGSMYFQGYQMGYPEATLAKLKVPYIPSVLYT